LRVDGSGRVFLAVFYRQKRWHSALDYVGPGEYETIDRAALAARRTGLRDRIKPRHRLLAQAAPAPPGHSVDATLARPMGSLAGECIFVADPCRIDRERLAAELRSTSNAFVITAPCVTDIYLGDRRRPTIVLISPHLDPLESLVTDARALYREARVGIIGYLTSPAAFSLGRLGIDLFFPKPVTGTQVVAVLTGSPRTPDVRPPSLARAEWDYLHYVLDMCHGNRSQAARLLGIHRSVLQRKLQRPAPPR
jgi:two-component system response regulator RegA